MFETVNRNIAMPDAAIGAAVILAVPDELDLVEWAVYVPLRVNGKIVVP